VVIGSQFSTLVQAVRRLVRQARCCSPCSAVSRAFNSLHAGRFRHSEVFRLTARFITQVIAFPWIAAAVVYFVNRAARLARLLETTFEREIIRAKKPEARTAPNAARGHTDPGPAPLPRVHEAWLVQ